MAARCQSKAKNNKTKQKWTIVGTLMAFLAILTVAVQFSLLGTLTGTSTSTTTTNNGGDVVVSPSTALAASSAKKSGTTTSIHTTTTTNNHYSHLRVLYVHIGKTGGEFLKSQLPLSCQTRKDKRVRQECFQKFQQQQNNNKNGNHRLPLPHLSQVTTGYWHTNSRHPPKTKTKNNVMEYTTHLLYSIRHPISRFISWYVYNHPKSCDMREPHSPSCKSNEWKRKMFQDCFPTLKSFVTTIHNIRKDDNNDSSSSSSSCWNVFWDGWYGRNVASVKEPNHLYWNYQYYWNETLGQMSETILSTSTPIPTVWVVRQEFLNQDVKHLDGHIIGSSRSSPRTNYDASDATFFPVESIHYIKKQNAAVVTKGIIISNDDNNNILDRQLLCACILRDELYIYQQLIQRAENLSNDEKQITIRQFWKECGVDDEDTIISSWQTESDKEKQQQRQQQQDWWGMKMKEFTISKCPTIPRW